MPQGDTVTIGSASQLRAESAQAPAALMRQAKALERPIAALVATLRSKSPRLIMTCARGSSAHAATYGKHLFERHLGIPVCAAAPVIASIYRRSLDLDGQLFVSISQSGRSADIIAMAAVARAAGAITVAVVNDTASPLAQTCELVLPIEAGPELSIAATKSFIATLAVLLRLTAAWADNTDMRQAIERLPGRLMSAAELDWSAALPSLSDARSAMTIGRGPTLAIAREAALKLKEVCNLHAEAFSGAEFQHGPIALVEPAYPVLMFTPGDQAAEGFETLRRDLAGKGALVFATATSGTESAFLPTLEPDHPDADAICLIHTFYQLLLHVAERRGRNVDHPRHLQKVTVTR
jgi:glucosamine--fructose-6-phosphate aminotransferase (isomerizing)